MSVFNKQIGVVFIDFLAATDELFPDDPVLAPFVSEMVAMVTADPDGPAIYDRFSDEFYKHRSEINDHADSVLTGNQLDLFRSMNMSHLWPQLCTDDPDDIDCREAFWEHVDNVHNALKLVRAVGGKQSGFQSCAMDVVKDMQEDGVLRQGMSVKEITTYTMKKLKDGNIMDKIQKLFDPNDSTGIANAMDAMGLDIGEFIDVAEEEEGKGGDDDDDDNDASGGGGPSAELDSEQMEKLMNTMGTSMSGSGMGGSMKEVMQSLAASMQTDDSDGDTMRQMIQQMATFQQSPAPAATSIEEVAVD